MTSGIVMEWGSLVGAELAWFVQLRHFRRTSNVKKKFLGNFISTVAHFMFYADVRASTRTHTTIATRTGSAQ